MKRYIIYLVPMLFAAFSLISCDLDFFPSNAMTSEQLAEDPTSATYITDGCYSMFKDEFEYKALYASGNSYVRHYFQMAEFPSDNICLSGRTTDVLYEATCYKSNSTLKNLTTFWWLSYKIIYAANSVIESVQDGESTSSDQLKGECYFIRALAHLNLVTLYAKPYSYGRENPGVVIRTSTNTETTTRATVGEVYDQIVSDLNSAIALMTTSSARGNSGYASKVAAQGLLTRVYLYMGENQNVVDLVDEMLDGADPSSELEPTATFPDYFANALTSKETLFAIAHTAIDTKGQASIGSMYLNDGIGWGEVYPSDPLLNLYERYPEDIRYTSFIKPQYSTTSTGYMISYSVESTADDFRSNDLEDVTYDSGAGKYYFTYNGENIYVETETVNGYEQKYIMLDGVKHVVRLTEKLKNRNTFPIYYVTKFSYQDDDPMLSSPVIIRWAEVILNRAEAYAKLSQPEKALSDVNVIRARAGLSGNELMTVDNIASKGYTDVLDVVLDERRLELAFEGQRMFDVYRNKKNMDREYAGVQPWEIVDYSDNKIQYPIPYDEVSVSGIEQNP